MVKFSEIRSHGWVNRFTRIGAALGLAVMVASMPASAATVVMFDGTGNPTDEGFSLSNGVGGGTGIFTLNSNDGTPNSAPGFMHQRNPGVNSPDNWFMSPTLLTSEGWFVETRFSVISNNGLDDYFGAGLGTRSDTGNLWTRLRTDGIQIGNGSAGDPLFAYPGAGPFHTLRIQVAPGDTTPDIYLDGIFQNSLTMAAGVGDNLSFGDHSVSGAAEVVYDYFVANTEIPEPSSMALIAGAIGGLATLRNRRRQRT